MRYTWINGEFFEEAKALLHVSDLSIQRGYGVFDFFRCKQKKPFLLSEYLDRFYRSAAGLRLQVPIDRAQLVAAIESFINRNQLTDQGIKMILTGGYSEDSYTPLQPNLIIRAHEIQPPSSESYHKGFKIITHEYQRESPWVKSINYLQGIYLQPDLAGKKLDDVLYYNQGLITEFPRSNFFMVDHGGQLITPANNILHGITRKLVLYLAKGHTTVEVRDIFVDELYAAEEAFLTSTTKGIMPISQVDGKVIGVGEPGPVTKHLTGLMESLPAEFALVE